MKKITPFIVMLCFVTFGFAQTTQISQQIKRIDSIVQMTNAWLERVELNQSLKQRYKLYPTENIYTFIQLL